MTQSDSSTNRKHSAENKGYYDFLSKSYQGLKSKEKPFFLFAVTLAFIYLGSLVFLDSRTQYISTIIVIISFTIMLFLLLRKAYFSSNLYTEKNNIEKELQKSYESIKSKFTYLSRAKSELNGIQGEISKLQENETLNHDIASPIQNRIAKLLAEIEKELGKADDFTRRKLIYDGIIDAEESIENSGEYERIRENIKNRLK